MPVVSTPLQVHFDLSDWKRKAADLGSSAKQIPYALATAMTWTMRESVDAEKDALPASFDRPTPFTMNAIGFTPANKGELRFEVFVKDAQAKYLGINVVGGTRSPAGAKTLATPFINKNSYGNVGRGALRALMHDRAKVFSGKPRGGKGRPAGIYRRTNENKTIRLLALYSPTLSYSKRFDFDGIFEKTVRAVLPIKVAEAVQHVVGRFAMHNATKGPG